VNDLPPEDVGPTAGQDAEQLAQNPPVVKKMVVRDLPAVSKAIVEVPEAIEMLTKIASLAGQKELASFLQTAVGRARVRAVHHLAGGNPRVYMLFSQFITREALDSLVQAFVKMLDDLTPYYQSRMKELSNQQRKIVELLVDRRHPVVVKDIAADSFIEPGTAASQLRDLRKMGYVEAEQSGRESFYELREKQRGKWVEIFVEFLRIWYAPAERKGQLDKMRGQSRYFADEHLEKALLSDEDPCLKSSQRDFLRAMQEQQRSVALETLEEMRDSQRLTKKDYKKLLKLVEADRYSEAQQLWSEIAEGGERSAETKPSHSTAIAQLSKKKGYTGLRAAAVVCDESFSPHKQKTFLARLR
jgi:DNA-binding MarR family transcriptional regulator